MELSKRQFFGLSGAAAVIALMPAALVAPLGDLDTGWHERVIEDANGNPFVAMARYARIGGRDVHAVIDRKLYELMGPKVLEEEWAANLWLIA